jgi:hypothetical protein
MEILIRQSAHVVAMAGVIAGRTRYFLVFGHGRFPSISRFFALLDSAAGNTADHPNAAMLPDLPPLGICFSDSSRSTGLAYR